MEQLKRELGEVNRSSNTLADELKELIKKFDDDDQVRQKHNLSTVKRDLEIIAGKLRGLATGYEPDPEAPDPSDPNITGKSRDGNTNNDETLASKQREVDEANKNINKDDSNPQAANVDEDAAKKAALFGPFSSDPALQSRGPRSQEPQGQPGAPNLDRANNDKNNA